MMHHVLRCAAVVLALILLAGACSSSDADENGLPDIELERLGDSGSYAIAGSGQRRVLNLWATWCAPCRAELPAFDAVAADVDDVDEIEIVGVNVGDTGDDAAELVAELGLTFAQVLDPRAEIQRSLRISGLPATIFVDQGGEVLQVQNGELTEDELRSLLRDLYGLELDG